jgi:hypothetical protein
VGRGICRRDIDALAPANDSWCRTAENADPKSRIARQLRSMMAGPAYIESSWVGASATLVGAPCAPRPHHAFRGPDTSIGVTYKAWRELGRQLSSARAGRDDPLLAARRADPSGGTGAPGGNAAHGRKKFVAIEVRITATRSARSVGDGDARWRALRRAAQAAIAATSLDRLEPAQAPRCRRRDMEPTR